MKSSRSKRQRLMSSPSYVSSPRPDIPARFESLNDDTLTTVLEFVGNKSYATYAGINKHCKEIYSSTKEMMKETFLYGYGPLFRITNEIERSDHIFYNPQLALMVGKGVVLYNRSDVLVLALQEKNTDILKGICNVAAEEGRVDILNEVLINVYGHDHTAIYRDVDYYAARGGKVNMLKWVETKGLSFRKSWCAAQAAYGGQLHILQWLREEQDLELKGGLFTCAIDCNQLLVMKWLKDQACPWSRFTFTFAAKEGNLEILQWLHNEGCPWPDDDDCRVSKVNVEPEVVEWLSVNGYGDRMNIYFH